MAQFLALIMPVLALAAELRTHELESLRRFLFRHEIVKSLVTIAATWVGIWLITTPAPAVGVLPGGEKAEDSDNERFVAQSLRFVTSFLSIGAIVEMLGADRTSIIGGLTGIILVLLVISFDFLSFLFIQRYLATRTAQTRLARQAALLKWIKPSADFVLGALIPSLVFVSKLTRVPVAPELHPAYIFVAIAGVVLSLWVVWFLFRLRTPFKLASSDRKPAGANPNR
jgi:hypothetical protein